MCVVEDVTPQLLLAACLSASSAIMDYFCETTGQNKTLSSFGQGILTQQQKMTNTVSGLELSITQLPSFAFAAFRLCSILFWDNCFLGLPRLVSNSRAPSLASLAPPCYLGAGTAAMERTEVHHSGVSAAV